MLKYSKHKINSLTNYHEERVWLKAQILTPSNLLLFNQVLGLLQFSVNINFLLTFFFAYLRSSISKEFQIPCHSVNNDTYLCYPRHKIALLICWATGEVRRWLFPPVVLGKTDSGPGGVEDTAIISMRCVTAVGRYCCHLCDDAAATALTLRPGGHRRACVLGAFESVQEGVCLCVWQLSERQGLKEGWRKRSSVGGGSYASS